MTASSTKEFYTRLKNLHHLEGVKALLDWDQQVYLPPQGAQTRGDQLEYVSVLMHQQLTDPILEKLAQEVLATGASECREEDRINARWLLRSIIREKKLPESFVAERARIASDTFNKWQEAKPKADFGSVKENLKKIVELARRESELVGYQEHPYDALLDQYEPEATVGWVKPLLVSLANDIKALLKGVSPSDKIRKFPLAIDRQKALCEELMVAFGLPKDSSRLDLSSHPFCTTIGAGDVRITTRLKEEDFLYGLGSVLHELGHALYEYNLPNEFRGSACGSVYSLGMHESQSRFIENIIGRSKEFSEYLYSRYSKYAEKSIADSLSAADLYAALNQVCPSLIRVDADEVSYSLHVVIRLLLEIDLIEGSLTVDELPHRWNQLYEEYLGIVPPTDREGVLQDVHWYGGSIGYFSTYVLGNIYDGIILQKLDQALPAWKGDVKAGKFLPITNWLKESIHRHAARLAPRPFMERFGGGEVTAQPFLEYLRGKCVK